MCTELQNTNIAYTEGPDLFADASAIIEAARLSACKSVNAALIHRNWLLGRRICAAVLQGEERAEYGKHIIADLSTSLSARFGKGFDFGSLYKYASFYKRFPILDSLSAKSGVLLSWTHYRTLLQVENSDALVWYRDEAADQSWSVRTLQRNISSQYYERTLLSQNKEAVKAEMLNIAAPLQKNLEFIKNPVIAEFLGLASIQDFTENDLEKCILDNLEKFMMELGKGYAFVARQQRIHTEKEDYFIDLVFYNYILKCFILIDLKTSKITHQDVGQMDMYVRMYDELKRTADDNPTLGIILCSDTDTTIARYSMLHDSEQLFASKYKLLLPSDDELRAEIEAQKTFWIEQHGELN